MTKLLLVFLNHVLPLCSIHLNIKHKSDVWATIQIRNQKTTQYWIYSKCREMNKMSCYIQSPVNYCCSLKNTIIVILLYSKGNALNFLLI